MIRKIIETGDTNMIRVNKKNILVNSLTKTTSGVVRSPLRDTWTTN